jgi:anti-anti-sigma factor
MVVSCSKSDGIGLVQVHSALTAATVDSFREQFQSWREAESDIVNYVLDLEQVDFMDSAGLGALIASLKNVSERGGDMKIANLQKKPRMVFEITRAHKVFELYDSVNEALKAYRL